MRQKVAEMIGRMNGSDTRYYRRVARRRLMSDWLVDHDLLLLGLFAGFGALCVLVALGGYIWLMFNAR